MSDSGTYDQATLLRRQKIAEAMLAEPKQPIRNWAEGLNELAKGAVGGYQLNHLDELAKQQKDKETADLYSVLGLPAPTATPAAPSPFSKLTSFLGGGDTPAPTPPAAVPQTAPPAAPPPAAAPTPTAPMGNSVAAALSTSPDANLPRGYRNMNPGNIEDGPFARSQPGYAGSDGRFAKFASLENGTGAMSALLDSYGKRGINTINGIINRWAPSSDGNNVSAYAADVAGRLGIGPDDPITPELRPKLIAAMAQHENGAPLPSSQPAVAAGEAGAPSGANPVAAALANPSSPKTAAGGMLADVPADKKAQIAKLLTSTNPTMKALGVQMLGNINKADAPTDEMKGYNLVVSQAKAAGQKPPSFLEYKTGLKKAGATNVSVDTQGENSFAKEAGKVQAQRFNDLVEEGAKAKQMVSDINTLTELGKNIGTGKGAQIKAAIGPYAEALGIKVDGLSYIQAYEAIVNRVAPTLRVKGSGAQSDFELKNFLKSLPSLGNTPEGNEIAANVMNGLQQNKLKAAEIGSLALNGEITRTEAEKRLRELPDPMEGYRTYLKKNPEAAKPASPPSTAPSGVQEGATATNPKTGERLIFRNGQWKPFT